jgi:hypothetical protein
MKKRFSEEQIVRILRQAGSGSDARKAALGCLMILNFGFVSDFEVRVSEFPP